MCDTVADSQGSIQLGKGEEGSDFCSLAAHRKPMGMLYGQVPKHL